MGQEPPAAAEEEAAPHEKAGSEAGQLLEAKLETPEEAALGELQLPENVILSKGENGDEVCAGNRKWGDSAEAPPMRPEWGFALWALSA